MDPFDARALASGVYRPRIQISLKKIRVIHLSIGLQWGGAETLMAAIASRLDPARFDVKIIALQGDGPVGQQLRNAGIPVTLLRTGGGWDIRALLRLKRRLAEEKPDIVHAHLLRANLLACLTRSNHAVVWHEHGTGEWLNPAARLLERQLMTRSQSVIAISKNVRDNLAARVPSMASRISILPNAIDTSKVNAASPAEKYRLRQTTWGLGQEHLVVGYVGRLDDKFKGISFLLKSIAQMKPSMPQLRLLIVGDGNDRGSLEQLTDQLGIKDSVIFTGSRSDLEQIYPSFDVLALPSLSEGFGIVLLEAMAHGVPVVASRVGGIPEVVMDHETGLLVPPADSKALSRALEDLLRDPERRNSMGQKGLTHVKTNYDLRNIIPKFEQIYFDIIRAINAI
jgi:glycosyltransferase involved in cell wall biosynthesis